MSCFSNSSLPLLENCLMAYKLTIKISYSTLAFSNKIAGYNFSIGASRGLEALAFQKCSYILTTDGFCSSEINVSLKMKISVYPIDNLPPACEDNHFLNNTAPSIFPQFVCCLTIYSTHF